MNDSKEVKFKNMEIIKYFYFRGLTEFPFVEQTFDAITYYQLLSKIVESLNEIIKNNNNQNENIKELIRLYEELKNYVDTYFDNLDIQTEVNNKLDEMAESGELVDIIAQYLELAGLLCFDTIESLTNASNISAGSFCRVFGQDKVNDGFTSDYKVRTYLNTDIIDDINIVTLVNYPTLIAEKINNKITNNFSDTFYYYIDGVNGDDSHNGLTPELAFKTIDRFFEELNYGKIDLRGTILTSGDYLVSKNINCITNVSIHLNSTLEGNLRPNVIFSEYTRSIAFYQSHINFKNLKISQSVLSNYRIYFEGCSIGLFNCDFTGTDRIGFLSTGFTIENLITNKIECLNSFGSIENMIIKNTNPDTFGMEFRHCANIRLYGNLELTELSSNNPTDNSYLMINAFSTVSFMFTIVNTLLNKYNKGILNANSDLWITPSREELLLNVSKIKINNDKSRINVSNQINTDWIDLDIISGTPASSYYTPKIRKVNNIVYMRGYISDLTQGDIVINLPEEFRPSGRYRFIACNDSLDDTCCTRIDENGNVSAFRLSGDRLNLDGVIYPIEK